jgi:hypothetical protein
MGGLRFVEVATRRVWGSFWLVPSLAVIGALGLSALLIQWDQADPIRFTLTRVTAGHPGRIYDHGDMVSQAGSGAGSGREETRGLSNLRKTGEEYQAR